MAELAGLWDDVLMESEGEKEIGMTSQILTRNLTGKWLMHTSDTEVCSRGKRCSFTLGHAVIEWLASWSLSGNTEKADEQCVLGSQKGSLTWKCQLGRHHRADGC